MDTISAEDIKKIVREVFQEMGLSSMKSNKKSGMISEYDGPKVLIVFHAGVSKLDEALKQVRVIQESAGKSSVFTDESARSWVCGEDVRKETGTRCILDTVRPQGLQKVLDLSDILVLPTFCLKVGAKVASLICDDHASGIVCSALAQGKKVLASEDGFLINETLSNIKIREEIARILGKLKDYGMIFCPTNQLGHMFQQIAFDPGEPSDAQGKKEQNTGNEGSLRIITGRDIQNAANNKIASLQLTTRGIVTPLARDLAKEYGIKIIEGE